MAGCKHVCLVGRHLTAEFRATRAARVEAPAVIAQGAPTAIATQKRETALPAWATTPERTESLVAGTQAYMWKPETHDDYIPRDHYQHASR